MALLPINKSDKVSKSRIAVQQIDLHKNSLSGDLINGGTITNFNSSGINDSADSVNLTIKNDQVEIESDLNVKGTIRVENLEYVSAQVPKLNVTEAVMVDHNEVLWKDRLGKSVTKSHLSELGILKNLQVRNTFYVADGRVGINTTVQVQTSQSTRVGTKSLQQCRSPMPMLEHTPTLRLLSVQITHPD